MRISRSVAELREALSGTARPLGLVPTMGALHEGHAALVRRCRDDCATVVVSVFVNPTQFGESEDLERYPRDLDADARVLDGLDVDVLFAPGVEDVYPDGFDTSIAPGALGSIYEGAARPGHFAGVCTVVYRLFAAVGCDRAYFGRKDAQQLAVIRRMVRDLELQVETVPVDTVRDQDGLALSSRNTRLSATERHRALRLGEGLKRGADAWTSGERDPARLADIARSTGLDYDYIACVDPDTFGPPRSGRPATLVAAVQVGSTRLIDNVLLGAG